MSEAVDIEPEASSEANSNPAQNPAFPDDWSLRPWVLAGLLAIAGLGVHLASDGGYDVPWRMALTAFFFFAGGVAAFTLDRDYLIPPAIFAGVSGLVMAGIAWRATSAGDYYSDSSFWVAAGILAVTLSLPLFQAGFFKKRFDTSYVDAHYFVWTDAISGAGALAFTGLSWLVLLLLSSLFELLNINIIEELMREEWFGWVFSGLAFGAALGVLRNQIKVLSTLQSVVLLVLSLLAVPLAIALILFLLAMIVSGPDVLWEATRSATPVLLGCAVGAFVLTNAVLRDDDADMTKSRVQQWAALILALGIFPLTVFAAVSMGTRIAQHGLSPERIWALIAIVVATTFGLVYLIAFIRGRMAGWRDYLRTSNLHLAVLVSTIAFILAMPLFNFGAISTSNQLSRLQSGAVSVADFDYAALRWDFGDAGREALTELTKSDNAEMAKLAKAAEDMESRYGGRRAAQSRDAVEKAIIDVSEERIEIAVRTYLLERGYLCRIACRVSQIGEAEDGPLLAVIAQYDPEFLVFNEATGEVEEMQIRHGTMQQDRSMGAVEAGPDAEVELRPFTGRQLYVDGKPASAPFE